MSFLKGASPRFSCTASKMASLGKLVSPYKLIGLLLVIALGVNSCLGKKSEDEPGLPPGQQAFTLPIEHAFGTGKGVVFKPRGHIVFRTLRSPHASLMHDVSLTNEEYEDLKALANSDGLYRIRSPVKIGETLDGETPPYVSSFVKACHLLHSSLTETITVSIDNTGHVIGISIASLKSECPQNTAFMDEAARIFNTTVLVNLQAQGAIPDTQTFVRRLEKEQAEKAAGKGQDNRSFFGKYWMYIVPVVLVLMLAGQQDQGQEGGQS